MKPFFVIFVLVNVMRYLVFPALFILAVVSCKPSRVQEQPLDFNQVAPMVFRTSLADSIPAKAFKKASLPNVEGIKISYLEGWNVRYFQYEADQSALLKVLGELPISIDDKVYDSHCGRINFEALKETNTANVSALELEQSSFFWSIDPSQYEAFECIKSNTRHSLLLHKKSNTVLHRIEFRS